MKPGDEVKQPLKDFARRAGIHNLDVIFYGRGEDYGPVGQATT